METLDDLEEIINNYNKRNWFDKNIPGIFGYKFSYAITHPLIILELSADEIKYAWQRIFKGYDERVSWSIDCYLAKMIPKWIYDLRNAKEPGIPQSFFDKYSLQEDDNYSEEDEKEAHKEWHSVLIEIENGFKDYLKLDEIEFDDPERKNMEKRFERAFDLLREHWNELWW